MGLLYDPPNGWMYGFPRYYKPLKGESLKDTLLRDGYPADQIKHITRDDGSLMSVRFIGTRDELKDVPNG